MSRIATTREDMVRAMTEITDSLDGAVLDAVEVARTSGPIKLLSIPVGTYQAAVVLRAALPRMVHRGFIYGDTDTYDTAVEVLPPKVRTNLKRWVWSQPWAPGDMDRLQVAYPSLVMHEDTVRGLAAELWPAYAEYTRDVSPFDMAMSFETAMFLLHLCRTMRPETVADYGSGFSSYVLRLYARQAGIHAVVSVDDDRSWLDRSIDFSRRHGVHDIGEWRTWNPDEVELADIVFHDLAGGDMRDVTMRYVMASSRRFAVVDDCQVDHHRDTFYGLADELGFETFALLQTNDHIQRFSSLAVRS